MFLSSLTITTSANSWIAKGKVLDMFDRFKNTFGTTFVLITIKKR